jgi:hypothetical protein
LFEPTPIMIARRYGVQTFMGRRLNGANWSKTFARPFPARKYRRIA